MDYIIPLGDTARVKHKDLKDFTPSGQCTGFVVEYRFMGIRKDLYYVVLIEGPMKKKAVKHFIKIHGTLPITPYYMVRSSSDVHPSNIRLLLTEKRFDAKKFPNW